MRDGSPQWLVDEVQATKRGLMGLLQNVCLLRDGEDPDRFYPRCARMPLLLLACANYGCCEKKAERKQCLLRDGEGQDRFYPRCAPFAIACGPFAPGCGEKEMECGCCATARTRFYPRCVRAPCAMACAIRQAASPDCRKTAGAENKQIRTRVRS